MRGGVIALMGLLLVCTLMAWAVSATALPYSNTPDVLYEIIEPGTYELSEAITETGTNETLILISTSGVTLNGNDKEITGGTNTLFGIIVSDTVQGTVTIRSFKNITHVKTSGIYHLGQAILTVDGVTIGDITNTSTTG